MTTETISGNQRAVFAGTQNLDRLRFLRQHRAQKCGSSAKSVGEISYMTVDFVMASERAVVEI